MLVAASWLLSELQRLLDLLTLDGQVGMFQRMPGNYSLSRLMALSLGILLGLHGFHWSLLDEVFSWMKLDGEESRANWFPLTPSTLEVHLLHAAASWVQPNGHWRFHASRWLARQPITRKLAVSIKMHCGKLKEWDILSFKWKHLYLQDCTFPESTVNESMQYNLSGTGWPWSF